MQALMLLLAILAAALIAVSVQTKSMRRGGRVQLGLTTQSNVVLTHQAYADAGGTMPHWAKWHGGKAYGPAEEVEVKARDWIHVLSSNHVLTNQSSSPGGRFYGLVA